MTMAQNAPAIDLGDQLMSDWFATVSYENDYADALPETEAEDPSDDDDSQSSEGR